MQDRTLQAPVEEEVEEGAAYLVVVSEFGPGCDLDLEGGMLAGVSAVSHWVRYRRSKWREMGENSHATISCAQVRAISKVARR